jgi:membrane fusion protein
MSLYREEALEWRARGNTSQIMVVPQSSAILVCFWLFLTSLLLAGLFLFCDRSRKIEAEGMLVAEKGESILTSGRPGVITKLYITEGARAHAAQPVAEMSNDRSAAGSPGEGGAIRIAALKNNLKLVTEQLALTQQRNRMHAAAIERNIERSNSAIAALTKKIESQKSVATGADDKGGNDQAAEYARQVQIARLDELYKERSRLQGQLDEQTDQQAREPLDAQIQELALRQSIAALQTQLSELETANTWIVVAPGDGVVGNLGVKEGDTLKADSRIATIADHNGGIELEVHIAANAISLMKTGNEVLVRFDAYPYQKYGQFKAVIRAMQLSSDSGLHHETNAGLYKMRVKMISTPKDLNLIPGMTARISVVLERRKLWEWLLRPLSSTAPRA